MQLASLRPTSTFLAAAFVGCASLLACAPANAGDYQAKRVASDARFDGPRLLTNPRVYVFDGFAQQKVGTQSFWGVKLS